MLLTSIEPITEDDERIRAALADADLPSLLPALAYLTGDLSILRDELRTDPLLLLEDFGGLTLDQQTKIRAIALDVLIRYRDGGCRAAPAPSRDDLHKIMTWTTGGAVRPEQLPLLEEELDVQDVDLRAPGWSKDDIDPERSFLVAIIGAGMSGLLAAHRLKQAGVPFIIIEKNGDVGGTWLENTYPGCRVDVTNHVYSYSFAQRADWPLHFSTQQVLLDYFRTCAEVFGLRPFIRFGTEVISASFDESSKTWRLRTRSSDGEQSLEANAIVSAVGQLNRPKLPEIAGRDAFRGAAFHSAQWRHDLDVTGKRVVVIGTGASAVQFIPVIAEQAADVTILQRTANWFFPAPLYHERVADGLEWLFQHVPTYAHWYRFWLFWRGTEALLPACQVDPSWEPQERSVSAANDFFRELLAAYIQAEFADRPDLLEKVLPTYPPASKRIVVDNGTWARTLKRPNVHLVTEKIESITAGGVVTADGVEHAADIIVYATGFQASRFLTPVKVLGRDGIDMHRQWDGNARAYLGITVPNFPNFFFLYGPNTNIVVNGSIIYFSECEVNYVVGCVKLLLESKQRAMDPRRDVHDAYNEKIDAGNKMMTWGASSVNSWYKSDSGRVAQNWPFGLLEYWEQTREPDPNDYELL